MAAFKDKKNGSWYVQFRYTDWRGERQQKLKRGFATKKDAQAWEREFLMQKQADVNMSFESFVELYEKDVKPKLKLNTWLSKEHIIRTKVLPYFRKRKLSEITARDVIDWQNEIRQHTKSNGEAYSPDYLKNVHTQLSCIFNHAIKYYGLQINPAAKAGNMGSEQTKEMLLWTKEEYLKFIDAMMDKPMLYYAFEILYWCGMEQARLSELQEVKTEIQSEIAELHQAQAEEESKLNKAKEHIQKQQLDLRRIEEIQTKPTLIGNKVTVDRDDFDMVITAAKKHIIQERKESAFKKALDATNKLIAELKKTVADLTRKLAAATKELSEYKSVRNKLSTASIEQENERLRGRLRTYEDVISRNNLWSYFSRNRSKTTARDERR